MGLGSEIRDPEKTYSGSRIQGSKRHRILDPGSGFATSVEASSLKDVNLLQELVFYSEIIHIVFASRQKCGILPYLVPGSH
jgi:hypothetical protein